MITFCRYIIYKQPQGDSPLPPHPDCLIVEFPDYTGPSVVNNKEKHVPIFPFTAQAGEEGERQASRTQYPLFLAYAMTIHASQGKYDSFHK